MIARCLLALAASFLLGCVSDTAIEQWEPVAEARFVAEDGSFSLELPTGWRRSGQMITRDGPELHTITFNAGDVMDPSAEAIDPSSPELLQAMEDTLAAQPGVKVLELGTATLDGLAGFRMHFTQEPPVDPAAPPAAAGAEAPAKREALLYAAIDGTTLYALSYEAADGVRFALDLAVFERLVASFRRGTPP